MVFRGNVYFNPTRFHVSVLLAPRIITAEITLSQQTLCDNTFTNTQQTTKPNHIHQQTLFNSTVKMKRNIRILMTSGRIDFTEQTLHVTATWHI